MFKTFNSDLYLSCYFPQLFILILMSCQGQTTLPRSHPPGGHEQGFPPSQELRGTQEWSRLCSPFADAQWSRMLTSRWEKVMNLLQSPETPGQLLQPFQWGPFSWRICL